MTTSLEVWPSWVATTEKAEFAIVGAQKNGLLIRADGEVEANDFYERQMTFTRGQEERVKRK